MTTIVKQFFFELEKYKEEGTDSMYWAEWGYQEIDEQLVQKFNINDWVLIKEEYKNKSDNIKALIAGHINLNKIDTAEITLEILIEIILNEQLEVVFEALRKITFGFVTSGKDYTTNQNFYKQELKGIFLIDQKGYLINKFFSNTFLEKVQEIADDCDAIYKNEIIAFLRIVKK